MRIAERLHDEIIAHTDDIAAIWVNNSRTVVKKQFAETAVISIETTLRCGQELSFLSRRLASHHKRNDEC